MTVSRFALTRRIFVAGIAGFGLATAFAGMALAENPGDISDKEALQRQQAGQMIIVDVRTPPEWAETGVPQDAITVDMQDPAFVQKMVELRLANPDLEIGFMCRSSNRSSQVQKALSQAGFDRVYSIVGGMSGNGEATGWIADGLPTEKCC